MENIFDLPGSPPRTAAEPEPIKRSKNRESLTTYQISQGKRTLSQMVEGAFITLQEATQQADWPTAVKAACSILDRAGFGPKSTLDVNSTHVDLTELSRDELADRAMKISQMLREKRNTIDVTPVTVN